MEKIRIYLDTNIIYGYFFAKVKQLKNRTEIFVEPKVIGFLRKNLISLNIFVSVLVKAELYRTLRTEFQLNATEISALWSEFRILLDVNEINTVQIKEEAAEFVKTEIFTKGIVNVFHFFVAKNENLYFVSGDKEIVAKGRKFYTKVLSYLELKELLAKVE